MRACIYFLTGGGGDGGGGAAAADVVVVVPPGTVVDSLSLCVWPDRQAEETQKGEEEQKVSPLVHASARLCFRDSRIARCHPQAQEGEEE